MNKYPIITMLDVNQGDSILIELPHNKGNILIDTGGIIDYNNEEWKRKRKQYSIVKNITIPYLKSRGIKKIDYLVITHGDFDHAGEAINLINNFKIDNVLFNSGSDNMLESKIKEVLNKKNINFSSIDIYDLNINNYLFCFINSKNPNNENEDSLVFYTKLNNYNILFMGDSGIETENKLLKEYKLTKMDILKVGHHGSKNSSGTEFINAIKPKISIISAGVNNKFNHPNKETIDNLKSVKTDIYVTNINGMIRLTLKDKIKIDTVFKYAT